MKNNKKDTNIINIKNKTARREYELLDKYVAGMVLVGTEIKSIREGKVNLKDGFCTFIKGELWVRQIHISPYKYGTHYNHEETRDRKLLLNKQELAKLDKKSNEKGLTIVPLRLFINNKGLAKIEIALGKGKKLHDKRDSLKKKDSERQLKEMRLG